MSKPHYSPRDMILKQDNIPLLLEELAMIGLDPKSDAVREKLTQALERARMDNKPTPVEEMDLSAGWDDFHEEYYLVVPDVYDPSNLVAVLFERLVAGGEEDPEEDLQEGQRLIQEYLGVIEEKEKISLREVKERLLHLTEEMKKALQLFDEEEYTEEEFDRLSAALDKAYFDPISEILEGVLVSIAGG